mmetsp:Transcript_17355/g.53854  ORF Transcript_17355/g.53854 Transcript_17355/m.53854 type:complete len:206 (+) Transcript_17355:597-1214(+)
MRGGQMHVAENGERAVCRPLVAFDAGASIARSQGDGVVERAGVGDRSVACAEAVAVLGRRARELLAGLAVAVGDGRFHQELFRAEAGGLEGVQKVPKASMSLQFLVLLFRHEHLHREVRVEAFGAGLESFFVLARLRVGVCLEFASATVPFQFLDVLVDRIEHRSVLGDGHAFRLERVTGDDWDGARVVASTSTVLVVVLLRLLL